MRTYTKEGKTYVSVTEIVGMMYPFDQRGFESWARWKGFNPDWITNESKRIGTKVHQWVENRFHGIEEWADSQPVDDKEDNYLKAVQLFLEAYEIDDCEKTVYNDSWMYAGTYDVRVGDTLYDVKTWGAWKGEYKRSDDKLEKVAVQLSMYAEAENVDKIAVAILLPDGNLEIEDLDRDDSWKDWIAENRNKLLVT